MPGVPTLILTLDCDPLVQVRHDLAADGVPEGGVQLFPGHFAFSEQMSVVAAPKGEPPTVEVLRSYMYAEDCTLLERTDPPPRTLVHFNRHRGIDIGVVVAKPCGVAGAARTAIGVVGIVDDFVTRPLAVVAPDPAGWSVQVFTANFADEGRPAPGPASIVRLDRACGVVDVSSGTGVLPVPDATYAAYTSSLGTLPDPVVGAAGWTFDGPADTVAHDVVAWTQARIAPFELSSARTTVVVLPGTPIRAVWDVPAILLGNGSPYPHELDARRRRIDLVLGAP